MPNVEAALRLTGDRETRVLRCVAAAERGARHSAGAVCRAALPRLLCHSTAGCGRHKGGAAWRTASLSPPRP
ncbi:hypothetical protein E2C01_072114 [Portunus trituberculatus]|uniref:Uncharacterized protein n=1 Tax=Portunus trituberculatus TaxID=210409 RepID=A0A5B7I6B2_PORTR|nr:hypothetical protein [Portunus trituberculatus]